MYRQEIKKGNEAIINCFIDRSRPEIAFSKDWRFPSGGTRYKGFYSHAAANQDF
jgi:hypothetical protein